MIHFPPKRNVPERQTEQVNSDRVEVVVKLEIPPAVHLAGKADEEEETI